MEILHYSDSLIAFDRKAGMYEIGFNGEVYQQRLCEFLYTFSVLSRKNPEEYLLNTDSSFDTVVIPMTGRKGKLITLSISDFLALRNLYMNEMYRLKLEDLLVRSGISSYSSSLV